MSGIKVVNQYGIEIPYDVAVNMMEDHLRETIHNLCAPCSEQRFFDKYCEAYFALWDEEFELNKKNPIY